MGQFIIYVDPTNAFAIMNVFIGVGNAASPWRHRRGRSSPRGACYAPAVPGIKATLMAKVSGISLAKRPVVTTVSGAAGG